MSSVPALSTVSSLVEKKSGVIFSRIGSEHDRLGKITEYPVELNVGWCSKVLENLGMRQADLLMQVLLIKRDELES